MKHNLFFSLCFLLLFPTWLYAEDPLKQLLDQGDLAASQQLWDRAIIAYEQAALLQPDNGQIHYKLGRMLFHKRQDVIHNIEQKNLQKYLAEAGEPDWESNKFILGGENEESLALLQREVQELSRAVALDDSLAGAHYFLGAYYVFHFEEAAPAEFHLKKAVALDPKSANYAGLLALAYMKQDKNQEAADCLEAILLQYPEDIRTRRYLAQLYHKMGLMDKARAQYETILSQAPKEAESLKTLFE